MKRALAQVIAGAFAAVFAVVAFLLFTEAGLRLVVAVGMSSAPEGSAVGLVRGRATGPILVEGLQVRWSGGQAAIAHLRVDWQPWRSLREGRVVVRSVEAADVRIALTGGSTDGGSLPVLELPAVRVESAQVRDLEVASGDAPAQRVQSVELAGETAGAEVRIERLRVAAQPLRLDVRGAITMQDGIAFDLSTAWEFDRGAGQKVQGTGSIRGPLARLVIAQSLAGAVEGSVEATVAAGTDVRWEAHGTIASLDTAAFAPAVRATLGDGTWRASGQAGRVHVEARATVAGLTPQPARFDAVVDVGADSWRIEKLGLVADDGAVLAQAQGEYANDALNLTFHSAALAFDGVGWTRLDGEAAWNAADARPIKLSVIAQGLVIGTFTGLQARIQASGTRETILGGVQLQTAEGDRLEQPFEVSVRERTVRALMRDGHGTVASIGEWRQEAPAAVRADAAGGELERACWRGSGGARICVAAHWAAGGAVDADLELAGIELVLLEPWIASYGWRITGTASGTGQVAVREGAINSGTLELRTRDAVVRREADGFAGELDAPVQLKAVVRVDAGAPDARIEADLGKYGTAEVQLQVAPASAPGQAWGDRAVGGAIRAQVPDLALFTGWIPAPAQPAGRLEADLKVGGTLAAPRLGGGARVRDASMFVPRLGTRLTHVQIDLDAAREQGLGFRASADAGEGRVEVQGTMRVVSARDWELQVRANGQSAQLADLPWLSLAMSPALEATVRPGSVQYSGKVRIDRAAIVLDDLGTGVTRSDDVVVVGGVEPKEAAWTLAGQVELELGKDVRITGYGFDGLIDGTLAIVHKPGVTATGRGVLTARDATYAAHGASLEVETGRLLFPGVSLDDVQLDVVAVRPKLSRRVGVNASGPLRAPELSLFSDPPMEDTEILSWLLTGSSASSADAGQAGVLLTAARELGLGGTEQMASEFAGRLGIEEFGVASSEQNEGELELRVGRHIAPKLLLSYVVGLGDALNAIELRYFLRPQWTVSTRTTEAGAEIEFAFTVER